MRRRRLLKQGLALILPCVNFLVPIASAQDATPATVPTIQIATPDAGASELEPVEADRPYRLVLLVPYPEDPFWIAVQSSVRNLSATNGVTLDIQTLSVPSVPEQLQQINAAIAARYDGILIGLVDAVGMAPGLVAANNAGIPAIAIDVAPIGGEVVSLVQTDNVAAARLAGAFIGEQLRGKGKVLNLQGDLSDPVAQDRDQGVRDGLDAYAEISVLSQEAGWRQATAFNLMVAQLPSAGEGTPTTPAPLVNAVFAAGPGMAIGAASAVDQVQADSVTVVGFGLTPPARDGLLNGTIKAVIAEYPERGGQIAVNLMVRHLNGETVPAHIDSGFTLVTRETLGSFEAPGN